MKRTKWTMGGIAVGLCLVETLAFCWALDRFGVVPTDYKEALFLVGWFPTWLGCMALVKKPAAATAEPPPLPKQSLH